MGKETAAITGEASNANPDRIAVTLIVNDVPRPTIAARTTLLDVLHEHLDPSRPDRHQEGERSRPAVWRVVSCLTLAVMPDGASGNTGSRRAA